MQEVGRSQQGIVGERLRLARAFRGLTQTELARLIAWNPARISLAEKGKITPKPILVEAIAEVTGFDYSFFGMALSEWLTEEECSFRRRRSVGKKEINSVLARGTLVVQLIRYLRGRLDLPEYSIPDFPASGPEAAEKAAEKCRRFWNLDPAAPISRIGRVLENAGVPWVTVDARTKAIDAFTYLGDVSLVFANAAKRSASRTVFDLAHELGHLVMHSGGSTLDPDRDREADRFAAAFLLPREGFFREFPATDKIDWDRVHLMKRRWRTSIAAIIRRAFDLGLIGAATYRRAFKYIYFQGWHRGELWEPESEKPETLELALSAADAELGESPAGIAASLGMQLETLEEVVGLDLGASTSGPRTLDIRPV